MPRIVHQNSTQLTLTMHDNGDTEYDNHTVTKGLVLNVDLESKYVSLNQSLQNPVNPIYSTSQGSFQTLPNGHALMGHGSVPVIEEYNATGSAVMTFQFGPYYIETGPRSFRSAWSGNPKSSPSVAAFSSGGTTDIYVSWNGATDVVSWNVYTGSQSTQLKAASSLPKKGFETHTTIAGAAQFVQVEAVSSNGHTTKSAIVSVKAS